LRRFLVVTWLGCVLAGAANAGEASPLALEAKISLGNVSGRIDHMALDAKRGHLFVAELGNDSLGVVDIEKRTVLKRLTGLHEPTGVAYVALEDLIFVANAGDGYVDVFRGGDFSPVKRISLKSDADNLRVDAANNLVFAGFGSGALAMIDVKTLEVRSDLRLHAHPEGFQVDPSGQRIFVNVPEAREIAVVDRTTGQQADAWKIDGLHANFPMALWPSASRVLAVYRRPARLVAFETSSGRPTFNVPSCDDADDVFVDEARRRAYVSCGQGLIDVFAISDKAAALIAAVPTASGARTSLFDAASGRLFVAARAGLASPATIWVYRAQ
jgi:hypothetical protein